MKSYKIKQLILCAGGFAGMVSCDDYLTEINPNEVQKTEYYKNLNETGSGLTAVYATLRTQELLNIQMEGYRSDLAYPGYGRPYPTDDSYTKWYYHTYDNSTAEIQNKWAALYKGLFRANQVIEGLNKLKASGAIATELMQQQWDEQMGQALFFRGTFHYYLSITYRHKDGNCAIIADKVAESLEEFHKPLSSPEEVLAFARKDLMKAYEMLPPKYDANTVSKGQGRVTRASAATILGNSYLQTTTKNDPNFMTNIDSAMVYYADVVENGDYGLKLVDDFTKINSYAGEFNSESIFEISYSKNHNTELNQWDENTMSNRLGFYLESMSVPVWLIHEYASEQMDPLDERNYYDSIPNPEEPEVSFRRPRLVSLRNSSMLAVVNDIHTPYYDAKATTETLICQNNGYGFGYYRHYTEADITTGKRSNWFNGKNVVVNKLSEVMINYAECMIYKGQIKEALEMLNQIRRRWGLVLLGPDDGLGIYTYDNIDYDQDALLEHLMYIEKPLETSIEGYQTRWTDLRRWDIVEKRFQKLANMVYYVDAFTYRVNGEDLNRWNSLVVDEEPVVDGKPIPLNTIDYEYDKTATTILIDKAKYNYYYPIPLNEVQNNMNIAK